MEAQSTNQPTPVTEPPVAEKKSFLKSKGVIYASAAVLVAALVAIGYTQPTWKKSEQSTAVSAAAPAASETVAAAPAAAEGAGSPDLLVSARQAFAGGDVQGAINGYRQLLAKNPTDINAMGELGNVLFTAGSIAQATQTYFDAANLAIAQNRPDVAEALLPVIEQSNPMLAGQLEDRLFDAQMRQDGFNPEQRG